MDIRGLVQFLVIYFCTTSHQPNFSVLSFWHFPYLMDISLLFLLRRSSISSLSPPGRMSWMSQSDRLIRGLNATRFGRIIWGFWQCYWKRRKQGLTTFWTGTSKSSASNSSFEARLLELLRSFLKRRTLTDGTRFFFSLDSPSSTSLRIATSSPCWPVSVTSFVLLTVVKVFEMTPFSTWPTGE